MLQYLLVVLTTLGMVFCADITVYDAQYIWQLDNSESHEHMEILAAIGGLVNRKSPQLFVIATSNDQAWFDMLTSDGGWLQGSSVTYETSLQMLVSLYSNYFNGAVLYDGAVPGTSNVAGSIAGIEDLLPILSGGSLYSQLVDAGPQLSVKVNLVDMFDGSDTGSSKCDAYEWFRKNYLSSRNETQVNPAVHGYFMDYWWAKNSSPDVDKLNVAVLNADWVIANKGILWDLDVWPDTSPNDDPGAPAGKDLDTLKGILKDSYQLLDGNQMIHVSGFVPWAFKYITEEHDGVATEWQAVKVLSAYNAFVDADACCELNTFANSAFYRHYPLQKSYKQNAAPTMDDLKEMGYVDRDGHVLTKNYVSFYVGDYDSAAWVFNKLKGFWDDANRGSVPLGWAVNPTIALRFPPIFDYMYNSLTPNDRITTGDSGAGYVNPTQLLVPRDISNLPSAEDVWVEHCTKWYELFDMCFTGFLINGAAGHMTTEAERMYKSFSPYGGTEQSGYAPDGGGIHMQSNMPFFQETDIPSGTGDAANVILSENVPGTLQFHVYRSILQSPTYHLDIVNTVHASTEDIVFVDPLVLSKLASIAF